VIFVKIMGSQNCYSRKIRVLWVCRKGDAQLLLSRDVLLSSIAAANKRVAEVINSTVTGTKKMRRSYEKYTPGEKAIIGNYVAWAFVYMLRFLGL